MNLRRIIPCLSIIGTGLVKTKNFKNPKYLGDPINAVKIFNEKEVDELIFTDIRASINDSVPNYNLVHKIASECFMPFAYGGGINSVKQVYQILRQGAEKIILNTSSIKFDLVNKISLKSGASSVVISIDVKKKNGKNYTCFSESGTRNLKISPIDLVKKVEKFGAGEIFLNSIDKDGTMNGYDLDLINSVSKNTQLPVIACGGAGCVEHFKEAYDAGADAVAAGSMFVYKGPFKAVLINYPPTQELEELKIRNSDN